MPIDKKYPQQQQFGLHQAHLNQSYAHQQPSVFSQANKPTVPSPCQFHQAALQPSPSQQYYSHNVSSDSGTRKAVSNNFSYAASASNKPSPPAIPPRRIFLRPETLLQNKKLDTVNSTATELPPPLPPKTSILQTLPNTTGTSSESFDPPLLPKREPITGLPPEGYWNKATNPKANLAQRHEATSSKFHASQQLFIPRTNASKQTEPYTSASPSHYPSPPLNQTLFDFTARNKMPYRDSRLETNAAPNFQDISMRPSYARSPSPQKDSANESTAVRNTNLSHPSIPPHAIIFPPTAHNQLDANKPYYPWPQHPCNHNDSTTAANAFQSQQPSTYRQQQQAPSNYLPDSIKHLEQCGLSSIDSVDETLPPAVDLNNLLPQNKTGQPRARSHEPLPNFSQRSTIEPSHSNQNKSIHHTQHTNPPSLTDRIYKDSVAFNQYNFNTPYTPPTPPYLETFTGNLIPTPPSQTVPPFQQANEAVQAFINLPFRLTYIQDITAIWSYLGNLLTLNPEYKNHVARLDPYNPQYLSSPCQAENSLTDQGVDLFRSTYSAAYRNGLPNTSTHHDCLKINTHLNQCLPHNASATPITLLALFQELSCKIIVNLLSKMEENTQVNAAMQKAIIDAIHCYSSDTKLTELYIYPTFEHRAGAAPIVKFVISNEPSTKLFKYPLVRLIDRFQQMYGDLYTDNGLKSYKWSGCFGTTVNPATSTLATALEIMKRGTYAFFADELKIDIPSKKMGTYQLIQAFNNILTYKSQPYPEHLVGLTISRLALPTPLVPTLFSTLAAKQDNYSLSAATIATAIDTQLGLHGFDPIASSILEEKLVTIMINPNKTTSSPLYIHEYFRLIAAIVETLKLELK